VSVAAHRRHERITLAQEFIRQHRRLMETARQLGTASTVTCTEVDWLMLKFSCSRRVATRLHDAATKEEPS